MRKVTTQAAAAVISFLVYVVVSTLLFAIVVREWLPSSGTSDAAALATIAEHDPMLLW
jgi:hypothetical protein